MKNCFFKIVSLLLVLCVSFSFNPIKVHATGSLLDQINQVEQQKQQTQQQKEEAEGQRDDKKNELNQLQFQQGTLKAQLNSFNASLEEENAKYQDILNDISDKKDEIEQKKAELAEAKEDEKEQYETMKKRLQYIYEQPDNAYLDMILSSRDFSTFLNIADYIFMISEYDNDMLEDYKQTTLEIAAKEEELERELSDLEAL